MSVPAFLSVVQYGLRLTGIWSSSTNVLEHSLQGFTSAIVQQGNRTTRYNRCPASDAITGCVGCLEGYVPCQLQGAADCYEVTGFGVQSWFRV